MKIITYFVFTLLSIFIQFCVMDFIQEKMQISQKHSDLSNTSHKTLLNDIIKNISSNVKPHALYYNMKASSFTWNNAAIPVNDLKFTNLSVGLTTPDNPSSIFDFYDENSSIVDFTSTTDIILTSTEVDNITEITLFNSKNQSSKGNVSKPIFNKDCGCNFLYNICDINCCCDYDCNEKDRKLFSCSSVKNNIVNNYDENCYHFFPQNNILNSLFCIVKTNLPDKRVIKQEKTTLGNFYKWKETLKVSSSESNEFNLNNTNEFIWILNKGSINYLDIPTPLINNYCLDRQPVKILKRMKSICNVRLNDLEMFHILNIFQEGTVLSPIENTKNSTALNCSTLFCAPCNIMACDNNFCVTYNKSIHEPTYTEKFHMDNVSIDMPFVTQEINVDFFLGNASKENHLELSGSPGYLIGRPIIISYKEGNHTQHFYNNTNRDLYFRRPDNKNGLCILINNSNNFILFGINKRTKCRYIHAKKITANANYTAVCKDIHESIKTVLGLKDKMFVSPYGNPYDVKDEDWIRFEKKDYSIETTGEIDSKTSKLNCYNIATSISISFAYEDVANKKGNKILQAECEIVRQNKTFDVEDISSSVTIDVNFIDITSRGIEEYAGGPHINVGLPKGFFYPFPSNKANICHVNIFHILIYYNNLIFIFK